MVFALLFIGGFGVILIFRERGWHEGGALVSRTLLALGGSNASAPPAASVHESICRLPLALFLLMLARSIVRRVAMGRGGGAVAG